MGKTDKMWGFQKHFVGFSPIRLINSIIQEHEHKMMQKSHLICNYLIRMRGFCQRKCTELNELRKVVWENLSVWLQELVMVWRMKISGAWYCKNGMTAQLGYIPQQLGPSNMCCRLSYRPSDHFSRNNNIVVMSFHFLQCTVMIISFRTDMPGQSVQTQIRLLLEEQSDLGLHCLPFCLHRLDSLLYGRAT